MSANCLLLLIVSESKRKKMTMYYLSNVFGAYNRHKIKYIIISSKNIFYLWYMVKWSSMVLRKQDSDFLYTS